MSSIADSIKETVYGLIVYIFDSSVELLPKDEHDKVEPYLVDAKNKVKANSSAIVSAMVVDMIDKYVDSEEGMLSLVKVYIPNTLSLCEKLLKDEDFVKDLKEYISVFKYYIDFKQ